MVERGTSFDSWDCLAGRLPPTWEMAEFQNAVVFYLNAKSNLVMLRKCTGPGVLLTRVQALNPPSCITTGKNNISGSSPGHPQDFLPAGIADRV